MSGSTSANWPKKERTARSSFGIPKHKRLNTWRAQRPGVQRGDGVHDSKNSPGFGPSAATPCWAHLPPRAGWLPLRSHCSAPVPPHPYAPPARPIILQRGSLCITRPTTSRAEDSTKRSKTQRLTTEGVDGTALFAPCSTSGGTRARVKRHRRVQEGAAAALEALVLQPTQPHGWAQTKCVGV
jgi:hypothetical protein